MKIIFLVFFSLLLVAPKILAQSCEENRALVIKQAIDDCSHSYCDGFGYCVSYYGINFQRFTTQYAAGYNLICSYTVTWGGGSAYWSGGIGAAYDCDNGSRPAERSTKDVSNPQIACASVVEVENQTLGERISIVGSNNNLYYYSGFQKGRVGDFKVKLNISGDTPRDYITSFDVKTYRSGGLVDSQSYSNTVSNQNYQYIWNGLTPGGAISVGPELFNVQLIENSPSGSFPNSQDIILGHFNAKSLGLGGWAPESYVFYSTQTKKIFKGNGASRSVEAKPYGTSDLYVAEEDGSLVYIFDQNGHHLQTKTGLLGTTILTFNYDGAGRLTSIVEPFLKTTTFNRNVSGVLTSITAPNGANSTVSIDSNGYLASVTNPNSETHTLSYYGTDGLLQTFQKPGMQISTFTYDLDGNLTKDAHSGGYFFELLKNASTYSVDINKTSAMGRVINSTVSENGSSSERVTTGADGSRITSSYSYDGVSQNQSGEGISVYKSLQDDPRFGKMVRSISNLTVSPQNTGSSITSAIAYDITLSNPTDPFSISTWSQTTQYNSSNNTITTVYNPSTKTFTSTSYLGNTSQYAIDNYERITFQKIGNLHSVDFTYTNENLTKIKQNTRETNLTYNSTTGLLQSVTNPLSQTTGFTYDGAGRVTAKTLPDSRVIGYTYDANGNIISVTPPGRPAHYFNLSSQELTESYAPPTLGGLSVVNTSYTYNLDKQLTQITRPDGEQISFNYNNSTGNLESVITSAGATNYSIDSITGLPMVIMSPNGDYFYLIYNGKTLSGTQLSLGAGGYLSYMPQFTASGNHVQSDTVQTASETSAVSYSYDDDENLSLAGDLSLGYSTPNGQLTGTSIGTAGSDVTDAYTYNNYGEVTGYQAKYGSSVIYTLNLTRDGMGRVSGKSQTMNSITDSFAYTFDTTGRLTKTDKNSSTVATYSYDSNSNRTGGVIGAQTTTAAYDNQDRLNTYNTLSFTYNSNGDLTSRTNNTLSQTTSYVYDVFGNLTQVTLPSTDVITYEVDGLNRRIGKIINGTLQKRWIYLDQYRIAAEIDSTGAITKRFIYGSKGNIPDYMIVAGVSYRIISDHLGSPRLVVKVSDGTVIQRMNHDEYGRVTEDTNPGYLPFGFAGGLYDNQTSLVRFGARDYDPEIGRWTSKDPIRFGGGDTNLFGYTFQDPVNLIDPSGKITENLIAKWFDPDTQANIGAVEAIVGAAATAIGIRLKNAEVALPSALIAYDGGKNLLKAHALGGKVSIPALEDLFLKISGISTAKYVEKQLVCPASR